MNNSWERLDIDEKTIKKRDDLAVSSATEKSRRYWQAARNFLKSIEKTSFSDLVISQRNWARNILVDLRQKGDL